MDFDKAWLEERLSVADLEKQVGLKFEMLKNIRATSNRFVTEWSEFAKAHRDSDEIWRYGKPDTGLNGEAGVVLLRKGQVVAKIVTVCS